MPSPSISKLAAEIRAVMPYIPTRIKSRVVTREWPTPPLLLQGAKLGEVELAPFLDVVSGDFNDIRGVFEEYLHYFVMEVEEIEMTARDFLVESLRIPRDQCGWMFGRNVTADHRKVIATLVAIASYKDGVELDLSGCIARKGEAQFGIDADGKILSRYVQGHEQEPMDYEEFLTTEGCQGHRSITVLGSFVAFYREAGMIRDSKTRNTVLLALRILYYRYYKLGRLTDYLYAERKPRPPKRSLNDVLSRIFELDNPMPMIWSELQNTCDLTVPELHEMFGEDSSYKDQPEDERVPTEKVAEWFEITKTIRN